MGVGGGTAGGSKGQQGARGKGFRVLGQGLGSTVQAGGKDVRLQVEASGVTAWSEGLGLFAQKCKCTGMRERCWVFAQHPGKSAPLDLPDVKGVL